MSKQLSIITVAGMTLALTNFTPIIGCNYFYLFPPRVGCQLLSVLSPNDGLLPPLPLNVAPLALPPRPRNAGLPAAWSQKCIYNIEEKHRYKSSTAVHIF